MLSLKRLALTILALCALMAPAAAQTPPRSAVLGIAPGATGTAATVTMQDGSGQAVPIGTLNPTKHSFTPFGLDGLLVTAANNAAMQAYVGTATTLRRLGHDVPGDTAAVDYTLVPGACPISGGDGGWQIPAALGGCWTAALVAPVEVGMWGAKFQGATTSAVDTAAVQAALNTKRDVHMPRLGGTFIPNACLTFGVAGQQLIGDGATRTQMSVPPTLSTGNAPSCLGIFTALQAEPGPMVRDIGVTFQQVDSADYTKYTNYPPLFYLQNAPRFRLENIICAAATVCIDARGGSGGSYITNLQYSAFLYGVWVDGAADTMRFSKFHWYNVNLTLNQLAVFNAQAIGIYSGRLDDLELDQGLFIGNKALVTFVGATGPTFGNITNTDFDSYSGVFQYGGTLTCASCTFTVVADSNGTQFYALYAAAGQFACAACTFSSSAASHPLVYLPNGSTANVALGSSIFNTYGNDQPAIQQYSGTVTLTGSQFLKTPNQTYNSHVVDVQGGRLIASSNFVSDHGGGGGTGLAFNLKSDINHRVMGGVAPGWSCQVGGAGMPNSLSPTAGGGVYVAAC